MKNLSNVELVALQGGVSDAVISGVCDAVVGTTIVGAVGGLFLKAVAKTMLGPVGAALFIVDAACFAYSYYKNRGTY